MMTLQLTESERQSLVWLFEKMLVGLKAATAYSDDRNARRELARRLEDLEAIEQMLRSANDNRQVA